MIELWSGAVRLTISHYLNVVLFWKCTVFKCNCVTILEKCKIEDASTIDHEYRIHMKSATHWGTEHYIPVHGCSWMMKTLTLKFSLKVLTTTELIVCFQSVIVSIGFYVETFWGRLNLPEHMSLKCHPTGSALPGLGKAWTLAFQVHLISYKPITRRKG